MTTPSHSGLPVSALAPTGRRRARRRAAALLAAGGLILGACGGDDEATTAAPGTEEAVEIETESEAEADTMGAFGPGCAAVPQEGAGSFAGMAEEPAATAASNNPLLSTLVSAVGEAGLADTLNGEGPFTIFAPTNEAFEAIPTETMDMVMADKDLLTQILTYHVVPGQSLGAEELGTEGMIETVEGSTLEFGADGTTVNGVDVICSDVPTANATVHIVDEVLLPPAVQEMLAGGSATTGGTATEDEEAMALEPSGPACATVPAEGAGSFSGMAQDPAATAASNNPALSTLVTAVSEAGLVDTLNGEGPFTIFAPTNDAFAAVPSNQMQAVMSDQEQLTSVLTYHVVAGERLSSEQLIERGTVATVQGGQLMVEAGADGGLQINGSATSVCMDVPTANATVHIIDSVLLPS